MRTSRIPVRLVAVAAVLSAGLVVGRSFAQEGDAGFKNVQVLKHVTDKRTMRGLMKEQAKALGVKCTHCHVQGKFDLDDKPEKVKAREMMRMMADLNQRILADAEQGVTCWTCHRGSTEPELVRPTPPEGEAGAAGE